MSAFCQDLFVSTAIILVFAGTLFGIFYRMTDGFGPFNTSIVIVVLVLFVVATLVSLGKVEWQNIDKLFFTIVGFAGGLLAQKAGDKK